MIRFLYALLIVLPEVIKFIKAAEERADGEALDKKVKEDFEKINLAFATRDAKALNELFKN